MGISSIQLTGETTFIKLTDVVGGKSKEDDIAVGDWLVIGDNAEKVRVLEIDTTLNRYRVLRQSGITTFHETVKDYLLIKEDLHSLLVLILI